KPFTRSPHRSLTALPRVQQGHQAQSGDVGEEQRGHEGGTAQKAFAHDDSLRGQVEGDVQPGANQGDNDHQQHGPGVDQDIPPVGAFQGAQGYSDHSGENSNRSG